MKNLPPYFRIPVSGSEEMKDDISLEPSLL